MDTGNIFWPPEECLAFSQEALGGLSALEEAGGPGSLASAQISPRKAKPQVQGGEGKLQGSRSKQLLRAGGQQHSSGTREQGALPVIGSLAPPRGQMWT